jgi:hypothetical protein
MLCRFAGGQSNAKVAMVEIHWYVRHAEGTSRAQTKAFTRDVHLREPHVPTPAAEDPPSTPPLVGYALPLHPLC